MKRFEDINWRLLRQNLQIQQESLVKAYREQRWNDIKTLQRAILMSYGSRALAVRQVTTSKGAKTPGIDGLIWSTSKRKMEAIIELRHWVHRPKDYKASPVKRVMIPKGGDQFRPLGIPTMMDRSMQALYCMAIEPIVEEQSDPNSYGFRKYRGCRDSIAKISTILGRDVDAQWVLDADIEKCFDRINHRWLMKNTPMVDKVILESWLKSGVTMAINQREIERGVPQGGVISPLLCNIALNGLEKEIKKEAHLYNQKQKSEKLRYTKVHVIRYADDVIITGATKNLVEMSQRHMDRFLEPRGLALHPSKTQICDITKQGFEFLGFQIFKRPLDTSRNKQSLKNRTQFRLIIRPSKRSVKAMKGMIRSVVRPERPIGSIIRDLNPKLNGWTNYFRIARQSMYVLKRTHNDLWHRMLQWGRRKHTRRSIAWILHQYTQKSEARTHHWAVPGSEMRLKDISTATFQFIPVMSGNLCNPYVFAERQILEERQLDIRLKDKRKDVRTALMKRDRGKCLVCMESLLESEEPVEIHHILARKDHGSWKLNNLVLLHASCHRLVTHNSKENHRLSKLISPS